MRSISRCLIGLNVSKRKPVQTCSAWDGGAYGVDGKENGPGKEPDGEKDDDHQAEEPNKKVGVQPVGFDDSLVIRFEHGQWPHEAAAREPIDAFPARPRNCQHQRHVSRSERSELTM